MTIWWCTGEYRAPTVAFRYPMALEKYLQSATMSMSSKSQTPSSARFGPIGRGGEMTPATRRDIPGDSVDGYAREYVCMPAHAFTKAPAGYTQVEAATLTCAGGTA